MTRVGTIHIQRAEIFPMYAVKRFFPMGHTVTGGHIYHVPHLQRVSYGSSWRELVQELP